MFYLYNSMSFFMEEPRIYTGTNGMTCEWTGQKDENVTVSISDSFIEIQDNRSNRCRVLPAPTLRSLHITAGNGKDVIHVKTRERLQKAFNVQIDTRGGNKLIIGTQDPMVSVQVKHMEENVLVLPDNKTSTYERYEPKIRLWNEANRCRDGRWKSIKRRLVYFFGRDLKFQFPLLVNEKIKRYFGMLHLTGADSTILKNNYFTTREHMDELNAVARPGDILLRYQKGYPFDRYFVGVWQHAGLYLKNDQVIDAMGNGTYLRMMEEFGEADGIVLLRINEASAEQIHLALAYTFEQIGKWYNVDFDDNIEEQYCSGLIVNAWKFSGLLDAGYRHGELIYPDDLLKLPGIKIIWTNRPDLVKRSLKK
jgi:hypothetical protein